MLTMLRRAAATIANPSTGKVTFFVDSDGIPSVRTEDGRIVKPVTGLRNLLAGKGLTGGGALAADVTLDVAATDGTILVEDDGIRVNVGTAPGSVAAGDDARFAAAVPNSRTISAGTGLTGGGDLTADRTFNVNVGTTAGSVAAGNDPRIVNATPNSRTITAGAGLTGGGDLTADRALAVNIGTTAGSVAAGNDTRITSATPNSRQVIAGTGLTGGGDFTADRTLAVAYGTAAGTAAQGNDTRITGATPNSRQVIAGTGLTGGGDLTADRTLAVAYGTAAGTAAQGNDARIASAVPNTRSILAGTGLTGGGTLAADRTLSVNVGTTAGSVAAGDDSRITSAVPNTRTLTAGAGLTGGGDLSANRTLAVNIGTTAGSVAAGDDARITGAVPSTRSIVAGTGLTGGGTLAADRTLNVNVGTAAGSVAAGDDTRIVNAVPKTRTITASNGIQGGGDLSADRTLVYSISIGGLKTGASYVYTVADRHTRYERSNAGAAMADTLPALGAGDAGWTLKLENRGSTPAEVLVLTTPNGTFQNGATTFTLQYGTRQTFLWNGTGWVYDTGNANLTRLVAGIAVAANDIPAFSDSSGRVLKNSGFAAAAATTAVGGFMSPADKARLDNQARGVVNVLDYGADPAGVADSLAAINAAIAALPNGGVVFFPAGTYLISATLTIATAHIRLVGSTRYNSAIKANFTTGDMVVAAQWYQNFEDLSFIGPGANQVTTKTSGFAINAGNVNGAYTMVRRCSFTYQYDCVNLSNSMAGLLDCEARYFAHSAVVVNHNSDHQIEGLTCDNNAGALPTGAGIDVVLCASLLLSDCNVIHANNALNISPATGVTIPSVKGVNCFFDTSVVGLNMTGAGSVFRCEFTNCWFSSMSSMGINMNPAAGGAINGVTFVNCDIYNNVAGITTGVNAGALVGKWKMHGCSIAGWTTGLNLVAGANHFPTLIGNSIGAISAFNGNSTGLVVGAGAYRGLIIAENDVVDNTGQPTIGALTITAATASSHRIIDNAGLNPRGSVLTPTLASGTVFTNTTGYRVLVFLKAGTTGPTALTLNGVSVGPPTTNQQTTITLEPGGSISTTYSTAPAWVWVAQ